MLLFAFSFFFTLPGTYSSRSPGWQSRISQRESRVENLKAFALWFLKFETFAIVMPSLSASSVSDIFLFAIITSRFITIMPSPRRQNISSFSSLMTAARLNTPPIANARTPATTQTNANTKTGR